MYTIGILGGIASGKSTVAAELARLGARVLDADRATHLVLGEPEIQQALQQKWGESVLQADGTVDRRHLAQLVFGEGAEAEKNRRELEALLHPRIRSLLLSEREAFASDGQTPAVVLDAPLLLEAGWDTMCDFLLFVDCPLEVRQHRAAQRGWSAEEFSRREAAQMPLDEKRRRATHVLLNSGSETKLRKAVAELWPLS